MIEAGTRFTTGAVAIMDYRCHGTDTPCGEEETVAAHRVVLIRRGAYWRHRDGKRILAGPAHALFDNAGAGYRVSHPVGGDDGTCLTYRDAFLRSALEQLDPRAAESDHPFPLTHTSTTPAVLLLLHLFRQRARLGLVTDLDVEETSLAILSRLIQGGQAVPKGLPNDRRRTGGRHHPGAERARKELVEAACLILARDLRAPHSLTAIAREVGCSPFHLTRIFRGVAGMPMHRYLLWLRCSAALDRVAAGERSLSMLALDLGFSSHSHFTGAFTRIIGLSPAAIRRAGVSMLRH